MFALWTLRWTLPNRCLGYAEILIDHSKSKPQELWQGRNLLSYGCRM